MRNYEKKSFFTSFSLFFIPLLIFTSIIFYMYYQDKTQSIEESILYKMKDYTYDFKSESFTLDIIEDNKEKKLFKIYHCKEGLCAYFEMLTSGPYLLKVIFNKEELALVYSSVHTNIFKFSIVVFFSLLLLSLAFAYISLRPMQEALSFLEDFLKDLIHDLNTPATSILLNAKLLRKKGSFEEIERIELSAKNIASLYKNLEFINPQNIEKKEKVSLEELINNKIELLEKIYPKITFIKNMKKTIVHSNKIALERIVDNLLSNACKYNVKNGKVYISISDKQIIIKDTGIGIKNIKNVFQRYYKENDTGLGIGMSIVKNLCDSLDIKIDIKSNESEGTEIILLLP